MLESLLIHDTSGTSIYHRNFRESFKFGDPTLVSGLISAIDSIGQQLFSKQIAVVTYGEDNISNIDEPISKILVFSRDLFGQEKHINFVFFSTGDISMKVLREVVTTIFLEIKTLLKGDQPDYKRIGLIVDHVIENHFKGLFGL